VNGPKPVLAQAMVAGTPFLTTVQVLTAPVTPVDVPAGHPVVRRGIGVGPGSAGHQLHAAARVRGQGLRYQ
jgi:hypothetical protein